MASAPTSSRRVSQSALGEGVGHVLGEDAHEMLARRRNGWIGRGLEVEFGPQTRRQFAPAGDGIVVAPLLLRQRRVDLPGVMRLVDARACAVKLGSSCRAALTLTVQPSMGTDSTWACQAPIGRIAQQPQRDLRVGVGDDHRRVDAVAAGQLNALRPAGCAPRASLRQSSPPASRAMSARMNETMPMPPLT